MSRPLIISDCDEVLLYMVSPFRDWLSETQGVEFRMEGNDFATALRWQESGEILAPEEIWKKLGGFFDTEMHRQAPIAGAVDAPERWFARADLVVSAAAEELAAMGLSTTVADARFDRGIGHIILIRKIQRCFGHG